MARKLAAILLALLASLGAATLAAGEPARPQETFEGTVDAGGQAGTLDVSLTKPGNLTAPSWAERALVRAAWEQAPSADIELELRDEPCQNRCNADSLAEAAGDEQVEVEIDIPDDRRIHWRVSATNGTAVDEPFEGTAMWFTPTWDTEEAHPATQAPSQPSTSGEEPLLSPGELAALSAGLVATALVLLRRARRSLLPTVLGLYHRVRDHELLANENRARIHELAGEEPGIHYAELRRRLDVSRGALEHHLGRLLEADLLVEKRANGYRCLFLAGHLDERTRRGLAQVRSESARRLVRTLAAEPGLGVRELARTIDRSPSTVSHHLDTLREAGIVEGTERGRELALSLTSLGERLAHRVGD